LKDEMYVQTMKQLTNNNANVQCQNPQSLKRGSVVRVFGLGLFCLCLYPLSFVASSVFVVFSEFIFFFRICYGGYLSCLLPALALVLICVLVFSCFIPAFVFVLFWPLSESVFVIVWFLSASLPPFSFPLSSSLSLPLMVVGLCRGL
jgi:hypothetical protein